MQCYNLKGEIFPELKAVILQEMIKRGIFISPSWIGLTFSHSDEDIQKTLEALNSSYQIINKIQGEKYAQILEGKLPTTVWTMKIKPTKKHL